MTIISFNMTSKTSQVETQTKMQACCSEPAKRKLLIRIGIGIGVAVVLLVVIIAVAVVMATRSDEESSDALTQGNNAQGNNATRPRSTASTTMRVTTESARILSIVESQFQISMIPDAGDITQQTVGIRDSSQTQWIQFETKDYVVYVIQKFRPMEQAIIALTKSADNLANNYNSTVLFCEDREIRGYFLSTQEMQDSKATQRVNGNLEIRTVSARVPFEVPSVILPLENTQCSELSPRLWYRPVTDSMTDTLGPTCAAVLGPDTLSKASNEPFPGEQCSRSSNINDICGCLKTCVDCASRWNGKPRLPSSPCAKYVRDKADQMSCSGNQDEADCLSNLDSIKSSLENNPSSCNIRVRFRYPCGLKPSGCQGDDCEITWCAEGFTRYFATVKFLAMCLDADRHIRDQDIRCA